MNVSHHAENVLYNLEAGLHFFQVMFLTLKTKASSAPATGHAVTDLALKPI